MRARKIVRDDPIEAIAALVSETLGTQGIDAVLSGGSVVSIYSANEFQSYDLDFIVEFPSGPLMVGEEAVRRHSALAICRHQAVDLADLARWATREPAPATERYKIFRNRLGARA